jgi:hypothetical protein
MWKEADMAKFAMLSQNYPEGTEEIHGNPQGE